MSKWVFITGACGYLGLAAAARLAEQQQWSVMMIDPRVNEITHAHRFCHALMAEPCDSDRAIEAIKSYRPSAVLHLAGRDRSDMCLLDGMAYWETDVTSSMRLSRACSLSGVKSFILASTCDLYAPSDSHVDEDSRVSPRSATAGSRMAMELLAGDLSRASGLTSVSLRFSSLGGATAASGPLRGRSGTLNRIMEAHVHSTPFNINGRDWPTVDGTPEVDLLHIQDAASAIVTALEWSLCNHGSHTFNVCTGNNVTAQQLVDMAEAYINKHLPYRYTGRQPHDAGWARFSPDRFSSATGWRSTMTVDDVLRDTVAWYQGSIYQSYTGLRIEHRHNQYR